MSRLDAPGLAAFVRAKRSCSGLGLREAAKEIGVSPSTLSRIENLRGDDLVLSNFLAVCDWLEVRPGDLLLSEAPKGRLELDQLDYIEFMLASELGEAGKVVADLIRVLRRR